MGIEPTPSAWKAEVLPLNYTRAGTLPAPENSAVTAVDGMSEWWRGEDSNLRRLSRQIYSLIPLTAREPLRNERRSIRALHGSVNGSPARPSPRRRQRGAVQRHRHAQRTPNCSPPGNLERVKGIEPSLRAWEAPVLPLNYTRGDRHSSHRLSGPASRRRAQGARPRWRQSVRPFSAQTTRATTPCRAARARSLQPWGRASPANVALSRRPVPAAGGP